MNRCVCCSEAYNENKKIKKTHTNTSENVTSCPERTSIRGHLPKSQWSSRCWHAIVRVLKEHPQHSVSKYLSIFLEGHGFEDSPVDGGWYLEVLEEIMEIIHDIIVSFFLCCSVYHISGYSHLWHPMDLVAGVLIIVLLCEKVDTVRTETVLLQSIHVRTIFLFVSSSRGQRYVSFMASMILVLLLCQMSIGNVVALIVMSFRCEITVC